MELFAIRARWKAADRTAASSSAEGTPPSLEDAGSPITVSKSTAPPTGSPITGPTAVSKLSLAAGLGFKAFSPVLVAGSSLLDVASGSWLDDSNAEELFSVLFLVSFSLFKKGRDHHS
jgi:hypothetical protein